MSAPRVALVHWNAAEATERAAQLRAAGFDVATEPFGRETLRVMKASPPSAIVIDLSRLPMQGRDVAVAFRLSAATRLVPIVFAEGEAEKVARVREALPDARFATWARVPAVLARTIAAPPPVTVVPRSAFHGYAGVPLAKKLGIAAGDVVALDGAPAGFERVLGGAKTTRRGAARRDLTLWFPREERELRRGVASRMPHAACGGLWIVWAKKGTPEAAGLTQAIVRRTGLAAGLVDYKVCAIDATWTGLRFTRRESRGAGR